MVFQGVSGSFREFQGEARLEHWNILDSLNISRQLSYVLDSWNISRQDWNISRQLAADYWMIINETFLGKIGTP